MADEKIFQLPDGYYRCRPRRGQGRCRAYPFPAGAERLPAYRSAKAIFINYTIAKHYGGLFNLRFDDTNPAREGDEYVQSILQDLNGWVPSRTGGIFYGSDYFERCYEYAEQLIKEGKALRG